MTFAPGLNDVIDQNFFSENIYFTKGTNKQMGKGIWKCFVFCPKMHHPTTGSLWCIIQNILFC